MSQIASIKRPSRTVAAVFNLEDSDERYMVGVLQRFHGKERLYRAHGLKRTQSATGRVVVEIASFNPPKKEKRFLLIFWEIDSVAIRFQECATMKEARAMFDAT